jgi:hypothetical protein
MPDIYVLDSPRKRGALQIGGLKKDLPEAGLGDEPMERRRRTPARAIPLPR